MASTRRRRPAATIAIAMLTLIAAMWAGLIRIGWGSLAVSPISAISHGPLMVSGFLGTVIPLERAVALGYGWSFAGPIAAAIGALGLLIGLPQWVPGILFILASLILVADFVVILRLQVTDFAVIMAVGAVLWVVGNVLWALRFPVYLAVPWWAAFLILTIAGERLEMSRMRPVPDWAKKAFYGLGIVYLLGVIITISSFDTGVRILSVGLIGTALWLMRFDIARNTMRQEGLPQFIGVSLFSGYVWLVASGVLGIWIGGVPAGPYYDALLHTVFLGFVMTMIIAHAPIILPAVAQVNIRFFRTFHVPVVLLHLSLLLRIISDLVFWQPGRLWGGMLNVTAIVAFLVTMVWAVKHSK